MNIAVCVKQIPDPAVPGALNADHTRLLRAWREEAEPTKELELQPDVSSD